MKKIINFICDNYLYFMMYSIIGWIYEVFLEVFIYHWGFTNRGVLFGPYCPVYGFGALIFIYITKRILKDKSLKERLLLIPIIFIICMVSATLVELITSYICELTTGYWPWQTYLTSYPNTNFEGRIALSPSIRFGLGGLLFIYILQPLFERLLIKLNNIKLYIFFFILGIFIMDIIHHIFCC